MRVARPVVLDQESSNALEQLARGRSLPARLVERAKIVLRAGSGMRDQDIAAELRITPEKAARWRNIDIWMAGSMRWRKTPHGQADRER
jgi:hypothetical protein